MKSDKNRNCRLSGMKKPLALFLAAAMAVTIVFAGFVPAERTEAASANLVTYSGHQQTYGNLSSVKDGATLGVTGQSKRIESITVNKGSSISDVSGNIMYRVHVQTYGTTGWKKNGTAAGTTGESKRLEAVQMYLTGDLAEQYDIYYRVHIQSYGWLAWVKGSSSDSGWAGSSGLSKRMEAIQIVLVEKDSGAPSSSGSSSSYGYITKDTGKTVIYSGHQQSYGDLAEKADSAVLGVTGQSKRLESISIRKGQNLSGVSGDIVYRVHAQTYGTMSWVKNGTKAGTSGESKRVEAIQAYLTGELAEKYDIYYRAHVQSIGWTSWVKGSSSSSGWCGTTGKSLRIEAIQVKIVAKSTVTHSYTSEITTEATCTTAGVRTYTCSVCGDSYTEAIAATGVHNYQVTDSKAATYYESGYTTYTCSVCGDSYTETTEATGLAEAQSDYNSAVANQASAQTAVTEAESTLAAAQSAQSDAQDDLDAANSTLTAAQAAVADAESELADAQAAYDEALSTQEEKIAAAEEALAAAEAALAAAEDSYNSGAFAFFEYLSEYGETDEIKADAAAALNILNTATYASYTTEGEETDATSLANMLAAIDYIKECNKLREANGLNELQVTLQLIAVAMSDLNWSANNIAHSKQYSVAENLAWGYSDPFTGWYDEEKVNYETDNGGETGHYLNIINSSYALTGFAVSQGSTKYKVCHGQVFYRSSNNWGTAMDVDDYADILNAYIDSLDTESLSEAVADAEADLETAQAYSDAAQAAVTAAEAALKDAQAELSSAQAAVTDAQAALAEASTAVSNAETALADAQAALADANTDLAEAEAELDKFN